MRFPPILRRYGTFISLVLVIILLGTIQGYAQTNHLVLGPDQIHPLVADPTDPLLVPGARLQATNAQAFIGGASWQTTGVTQTIPSQGANAKALFFVRPGEFGLPADFKIGDITRISWSTFRDFGTGVGTPRTGAQQQELYLTIYTAPTGGPLWHSGRLQSEPMYAYNRNMPNATWITWDTDSSGGDSNILSFHDSSPIGGTNIGFYGGPTWSDILTSPITWTDYANSGGGATATPIDYADRDLLYLVFETGTPWDVGFDGYLDQIIIEVDTDNDGIADVSSVIDLELGDYQLGFTEQPDPIIYIGDTFDVEVTLFAFDGITPINHITDDVTLTLNTGTLGGTINVPLANGVATFTDLSVDTTGTYTLTANINGYNANSGTFTVLEKTITEHNYTLYLDDFTNVTSTQPTDLGTPITFGPDRANFFTDPAYNWATLQIGHTSPAEAEPFDLLAETLTGDSDASPHVGVTAWRSIQSFDGGGSVIAPPSAEPANTFRDAKIELLIEPHKLLGSTEFDVNQIVDIRWQTHRNAISDHTYVDWYASIWAGNAPVHNGHPIGLINFEAYHTIGTGNVVNGDWVQHSARSMWVHDPWQGATGQSPKGYFTLDDVRAGIVNYSTGTVDYTNYNVKAIAFATASDWSYLLDSHLDDLQIDVETSPGNIARIIINLEARTPVYSSNPVAESIINLETAIGTTELSPFSIENLGSAPLTLQIDTNPILDEAGFYTSGVVPTLNPGEAYTLYFRCGNSDPAHVAGQYNTTVSVTHNGVGEPSPVEYYVECTITEPLYTSIPAPSAPILIDAINDDQAVSTTITVENTGDGALTVSASWQDGSYAGLVLANDPVAFTLNPSESTDITIDCASIGNVAGVFTDTLLIQHNALNEPSTIEHEVTCNITDPAPSSGPIYSSVPSIGSTINFDENNIVQTLEISNLGTEDLELVLNASGSFGRSNPTLTIAPAETSYIFLYCLETEIGSYSGSLLVQHNDPNIGGFITYDLECNLADEPPVFESDPVAGTLHNPMVSLFHTPVNTARVWPIEITNAGGGELIIERVDTNQADVFTFNPSSLSLAAGETSTLEAICLSDTPGRYDATIHILHNAAFSPATYAISCVVDETPSSTLSMYVRDNNNSFVFSGQTIANEVDQLHIHFSSPVFDDETGDDPDSATNPENYILLEGWDISTASCSDGVSPDDTRIQPVNVVYDSTLQRTTLHFDPPLGAGEYSLIVCGTTSIVSATDRNSRLGGGVDVVTRFLIDPTIITPTPTAEPTVAPTTEPTVAPTTEPTVAPTAAPTSAPPVAPTASQPEDLGVSELPATGETPTWSDLLRRIFGW